MATVLGDPVPYEKQLDAETDRRMCGAAALAMVYRSFGLEITQQDLWPKITGRNPRGTIHAKSFLLCRDALSRGYLGMVLRARHPWDLLRASRKPGVQVIVNHRISRESRAGHYSVVVGCQDDEVALHDPRMGPDRKLSRDEFLELWQPSGERCEITGNIAIVLTKQIDDSAVCTVCSTMIPPAFTCKGCKRTVPLRPASVLGCSVNTCSGRRWQAIFCPFCDTALEALDPWNPAALLQAQKMRLKPPMPEIPSGQSPKGPVTKETLEKARKEAAMSSDLPSDMNGALDKLRGLFSSSKLEGIDTISRERLDDLVARLQEGHDKTLANFKEMGAKWQSKADELQQAASEMQSRMNAAVEAAKSATPPTPAVAPPKAPAVAAPKPPAAEEPKLDAKTGRDLKESLLGRFGKRPAAGPGQATGAIDDRVEWKDWLDNQ